MILSDTIIALATPQGTSGIAIIRMSGVKAFDITDIFFVGKKISAQKTHTSHFGKIMDGNRMIDEEIV